MHSALGQPGVLVIMAVVTTVMTGPLLRALLPRAGYQVPVGIEA